ncbi:hypothetical protein NBRC116494_23790 [Aurantivibrio plasticivorans]
MQSNPETENVTTLDTPKFSLTNQRIALEYLNEFINDAPTDSTISTDTLQEVLLGSSVFTLTPESSEEHLNLLIFLASRFEKVIDEFAQLYMLGPAESLLEFTWLQSEKKLTADRQRSRLYFIYNVIMDFYSQATQKNQGLPIPYDVQPIPSLGP